MAEFITAVAWFFGSYVFVVFALAFATMFVD